MEDNISGDYDDFDNDAVNNLVSEPALNNDLRDQIAVIHRLMIELPNIQDVQNLQSALEEHNISVDKSGSWLHILDFLYHLLKPGQLH